LHMKTSMSYLDLLAWLSEVGTSLTGNVVENVYRAWGTDIFLFKLHGRDGDKTLFELVVLNGEDKTPEQELIEDLISILVSFSEKLQGMGSHKYEKVRKCVEEIKA